ncbi:hypothetical protein DMUE_6089, partial [Dictyocoela muelleri]
KSNVWLLDGTFYTSPIGFEQILIIHYVFFEKVISMMYVIMKRKNQNSYNKIFEIISKKIRTDSPKYIILNFEKALFNSLIYFFPNYILNGCYFNMTQIIMRFLKSSSLVKNYKENAEFRKFVKYLLILPYFLQEEVMKKYNNLSKKINQKDENFKKVYEYFFRIFLTFENKHSIKNIAFWSINNRIINDIPTTTNSCEPYHRYLNSKIKRKNQK